jgi:hypothetical protein
MRVQTQEAEARPVYSVCVFKPGWVVPEVQFLEAGTDQEALDLAGSISPFMMREIWDGHRLVRVLRARGSAGRNRSCGRASE